MLARRAFKGLSTPPAVNAKYYPKFGSVGVRGTVFQTWKRENLFRVLQL
jgi:hypothetical protein